MATTLKAHIRSIECANTKFNDVAKRTYTKYHLGRLSRKNCNQRKNATAAFDSRQILIRLSSFQMCAATTAAGKGTALTKVEPATSAQVSQFCQIFEDTRAIFFGNYGSRRPIHTFGLQLLQLVLHSRRP